MIYIWQVGGGGGFMMWMIYSRYIHRRKKTRRHLCVWMYRCIVFIATVNENQTNKTWTKLSSAT